MFPSRAPGTSKTAGERDGWVNRESSHTRWAYKFCTYRYPSIPGTTRFTRECYRSSNWPRHFGSRCQAHGGPCRSSLVSQVHSSTVCSVQVLVLVLPNHTSLSLVLVFLLYAPEGRRKHDSSSMTLVERKTRNVGSAHVF